MGENEQRAFSCVEFCFEVWLVCNAFPPCVLCTAVSIGMLRVLTKTYRIWYYFTVFRERNLLLKCAFDTSKRYGHVRHAEVQRRQEAHDKVTGWNREDAVGVQGVDKRQGRCGWSGAR